MRATLSTAAAVDGSARVDHDQRSFVAARRPEVTLQEHAATGERGPVDPGERRARDVRPKSGRLQVTVVQLLPEVGDDRPISQRNRQRENAVKRPDFDTALSKAEGIDDAQLERRQLVAPARSDRHIEAQLAASDVVPRASRQSFDAHGPPTGAPAGQEHRERASLFCLALRDTCRDGDRRCASGHTDHRADARDCQPATGGEETSDGSVAPPPARAAARRRSATGGFTWPTPAVGPRPRPHATPSRCPPTRPGVGAPRPPARAA